MDTQARSLQSALVDRLQGLGVELRASLGQVVAAIPGAPHRPGRLAARLGVNRSVASSLLRAVGARDPLEVLHSLPGLEPLLRIVETASSSGALGEAEAARARAALEQFTRVIHEEAGTRPALDAILAARLPAVREQLESSAKYSVFKGLAQLKGVQADLWLGAAVVGPSAEDAERHDLTWLNGAVAMQRMRPGVTVRFSYRHRREEEGSESPTGSPSLGVLPLDGFCVNQPARLEARTIGDTIQYTLPDDLLGPRAAVDMFVVDHHPAALRRFARTPGNRTSFFVEPAIPVARLVFDTFVHREAFAGVDPDLLVYETAYEGIADVNDRDRDPDRVEVRERMQYLGRGLPSVELEGMATYSAMMQHLASRFGWQLEEYRGFRTSIAYPVHGWQVCMAFEQPPPPGA